MRAKVVVFPMRGRNWCFSRSIDPATLGTQSSNSPSTVKQLYDRIFSSPQSSKKSSQENKVEVVVDFAVNKMNGAWSTLEKAPEGSVKNKIHGFGVKLLSRVKPSEIFFKSIPKETNAVEIIYPPSLNPRLVRRRLRHLAFRGSVIHKKYFIGSAILLPLTSVFMILPLPNIPFFWVLFRAYSHWRASQGSEKILHLVSDQSAKTAKGTESNDTLSPPLVIQPNEEMQKLLQNKDAIQGLDESTVSKICKMFYLNYVDVLKYRDSM